MKKIPLFFLLALGVAPLSAEEPVKPNVIVIMADDFVVRIDSATHCMIDTIAIENQI